MNTDELTNPPCPSASGYRRPTSRSVVSGENANADQQVLWDSHPPNNPYYSTTLRARAHTQKHKQTTCLTPKVPHRLLNIIASDAVDVMPGRRSMGCSTREKVEVAPSRRADGDATVARCWRDARWRRKDASGLGATAHLTIDTK